MVFPKNGDPLLRNITKAFGPNLVPKVLNQTSTGMKEEYLQAVVFRLSSS